MRFLETLSKTIFRYYLLIRRNFYSFTSNRENFFTSWRAGGGGRNESNQRSPDREKMEKTGT